MKKISFCGISGSGMSALAQILRLSGNEVRGSDRSFDMQNDTFQRQALEQIGINIYPQDGSAISAELDFVCASTAVEDSIPDIKKAKELNIPIKTRPQLLSEIFHSYPQGIAIGGTSGKTTTTAMIGYILDRANLKPCVINGGLLIDYTKNKGIPNIIYNKGNICVVEADESNGSIDLYNPYISVINNISHDHKSIDELIELFQNLCNRTSHTTVINVDNIYCQGLKHPNIKTFSLENSNADFFAHHIKALPLGTQYTLDGKQFSLKLIGRFNVSNALGAIATCSCLGIDKFTAAEILQDFSGTKRRLEVIGQKNNITVIDDFAHNPDKISASVKALRQYNGRLIIMFQPHGFGPMRSMGKEIIESFINNVQSDDILLMPEIFFAGGSVNRDISSKDLINYAHQLGKDNAYFYQTKQQVADYITQTAQPNDRIVIMGARDNTLTDLCRQILERL